MKNESSENIPSRPPNENSNIHSERFIETAPDEVSKSKQEAMKGEQENLFSTEEKIEDIRKQLLEMDDKTIVVERDIASNQTREQKIRAYQDHYLPPYLQKRKDLIGTFITDLYANSVSFEVQGRENIPNKGPFIVTCNHFGGGEVEAILKTFKKYDMHFGLAKNIWWNTSPILRWIFKRMQMIPIEESLRNISEEQKEEALLKQGHEGKKVFRKIIDREKRGGVPINMSFFHQAVAVLSRGDVLCMFPEGLWFNPVGVGKMSHEKEELKQGYRGMELVSRQYKKLTGIDLPILPLAFIADREHDRRHLSIGKPLLLEENPTSLNGTDWSMTHVARMLPEEQRGYYTRMVNDISGN